MSASGPRGHLHLRRCSRSLRPYTCGARGRTRDHCVLLAYCAQAPARQPSAARHVLPPCAAPASALAPPRALHRACQTASRA
eukprot:123626-Alexandrium_andersonii.AAC.1